MNDSLFNITNSMISHEYAGELTHTIYYHSIMQEINSISWKLRRVTKTMSEGVFQNSSSMSEVEAFLTRVFSKASTK